MKLKKHPEDDHLEQSKVAVCEQSATGQVTDVHNMLPATSIPSTDSDTEICATKKSGLELSGGWGG